MPGVLSSDDVSPRRELRSITRRLWLALFLGVPLIGLGLTDALAVGRPVHAALGEKLVVCIQALLCTPVVVVCGAPFFLRAWRSARSAG